MDLFKQGYNCSQAVLLAFAEELGIDETTATSIATPFGGGMGRMREVCGAVSGMILAANILRGNSDIKDKAAKDKHYALIQHLAGQFREKNGSIICRELLNLQEKGPDKPVSEERTSAYYKKRPCAELVALAAEILEKELSL